MTDVELQVPRHWLPTHPLLQLPQLAQVQGMHGGQIHGWRGVPAEGGLPGELVQVCRHGLGCAAAALLPRCCINVYSVNH